MVEDDATPPDPAEAKAPPARDEGDTRTRLAEAQLEQAMDGYHALRAENEALQAEVAELREKTQAHQEIGASLERQKRAAARELKTEREGIYARYIDILDNFDRAFDTNEARAASHSLMEGFILVRNQVVQVLRDGGFDRIRTLGLPYDPNTSEAMDVEDVDDPTQDGVVVRELVRGYRLDDHVVRPATVVVGRYPSSPTEDSVPTEGSEPKEDSGETVRIPEDESESVPPKEDSGETLRIPEEESDEALPVDAPEEKKD